MAELRDADSSLVPARLSEEPGQPGQTGAVPGKPVAGGTVTTTEIKAVPADRARKGASKGSNSDGDEERKKQLLLAAGVVAAGVAAVLGVRHFRSTEPEPEEDALAWAKRKVSGAKHDAKRAGKKVESKGSDALGDAKHGAKRAEKKAEDKGSNAMEAVGSAWSTAGSKVSDAVDDAKDKAESARQEAKEKVEAETKKADHRANSPGNQAEQRRMAFGQHDSGAPKGPQEDAGFLGFRNWLPGAKK